MKRFLNIFFIGLFVMFTMSSCLYHNLEDLDNSSDKEMTKVTYTYRFLYNDTIKKGTVNQEIQKDRVCEVIFKNKEFNIIEEGSMKRFKTTINYDINSIQKAGPSGSVTKDMLFDMFKEKISKDGLKSLWVYVSISDAAKIAPIDDAPRLGTPGDFSIDRIYRVTAADGSCQDYVLETIKGF